MGILNMVLNAIDPSRINQGNSQKKEDTLVVSKKSKAKNPIERQEERLHKEVKRYEEKQHNQHNDDHRKLIADFFSDTRKDKALNISFISRRNFLSRYPRCKDSINNAQYFVKVLYKNGKTEVAALSMIKERPYVKISYCQPEDTLVVSKEIEAKNPIERQEERLHKEVKRHEEKQHNQHNDDHRKLIADFFSDTRKDKALNISSISRRNFLSRYPRCKDSINNTQYFVKVLYKNGKTEVAALSMIKDRPYVKISYCQPEDTTLNKRPKKKTQKEKRREKFELKVKELSDFRDGIIRVANYLNRMAKKLSSNQLADSLWMNNAEAYAKFKMIGTTSDGSPVSLNDFCVKGLNLRLIDDLKHRIVASMVALHEIDCALRKELDPQIGFKLGIHHYIYLNASEKYTFPLPLNKKDKEVMNCAKYSLFEFASVLEKDRENLLSLYSEYRAVVQGGIGEEKISTYLEDMVLPSWRVLKNAIFPAYIKNSPSDHFECDAVVITEEKIFILEIKNYEKGSMKVYSDGRVEHFDSKGNRIQDSWNMLEQCENHVTNLSRLLLRKYDQAVAQRVTGVIVIANDQFDVSGTENIDYPIVRKPMLSAFIRKHTRTDDGKIIPSEIAKYLSEYLLEDKPRHYSINKFILTKERIKSLYNITYLINSKLAKRIMCCERPVVHHFDSICISAEDKLEIDKWELYDIKNTDYAEYCDYSILKRPTTGNYCRELYLKNLIPLGEIIWSESPYRDKLHCETGWLDALATYAELC